MTTTVELRKPEPKDGAGIWRLIRRAGTLDLNSPYCYLLLSDMFRDTCVLVEKEGETIGFVSAFVRPNRLDTLFVWQIAVDPAQRGEGLAKAMLQTLLQRPYYVAVRYLEATVSSDNTASRRLFESFAEAHHAACTIAEEGYTADMFPEKGHAAEPLLRIGPFPPA